MKHRLILASLLFVAACSKKDAPADDSKQYGEPVGIRLSGNGQNDPTYEIAFAVTKGSAAPAPNEMAGPVYVAAKSCSQVRDVTKNGNTLRVKVVLENGTVRAPASMPEDPAAVCLLKALDGKVISKVNAPTKADILIELRAPEKAS